MVTRPVLGPLTHLFPLGLGIYKGAGVTSYFCRVERPHVCELRETMKALQTKARDLASSTVDAEEVYAKYPGWKIRDS